MKSVFNKVNRTNATQIGNLNDVLDVAITAPTNGQVLTYSGGQWINQNNTDLVSSVFGRIGAVVSQNGDYNISQITNSSVLANSSNINFSGLSEGQILKYESGQWKNRQVFNTLYTPATTINPAVANTHYFMSFGGNLTVSPLNVGERLKITAAIAAITINFTGSSFVLNWNGSGGTSNPTIIIQNTTIELVCLINSGQTYYEITTSKQNRINASGSVFTINGQKQSSLANFDNIPDVVLTNPINNNILRFNGTNWINDNLNISLNNSSEISFSNNSITLGSNSSASIIAGSIANSKLANSSITLNSAQTPAYNFSLNNIALGGSSTLTINDATASNSGLMNFTAQTFAGNKTFNNNIVCNGNLTLGSSSVLQGGLFITLQPNATKILDRNGLQGTTNQVLISNNVGEVAWGSVGGGGNITLNSANSSSYSFSPNPVSVGGSTTLTINEASSVLAGLVSTGTQNFAGNKNFDNDAYVAGRFTCGTNFDFTTTIVRDAGNSTGSTDNILVSDNSGRLFFNNYTSIFRNYFVSSTNGNLTTNNFLFLNGTGQNSTEFLASVPISITTRIRTIYVRLGTAPGAGNSRTFTVRKNGVNTALTITISNTATNNFLSNEISFAFSDLLSLQNTATGTPAASSAIVSIQYI